MRHCVWGRVRGGGRRAAGRCPGRGSVLLAALVLLGACNGPTVHSDPPGVSRYEVQVRVDPPSLQEGQKATIDYAFTDKTSGKQIADLPLVGDTSVHTTLVNHDLTWFRTGKAVGAVNGAYPVNVRFAGPDTYHLYAEFTSGYTPTERLLYTHTLTFGSITPAADKPAPLVESTATQNAFYGVAVKLDTSQPFKSGTASTIHYTLSTGGRPVRDLSAFDGAAGHLFIISADGEEFAHEFAREAANGTMNAQNETTGGGATGSTGGAPEAPLPGATPAPNNTPLAGTPTAGGPAGAGIGPDLTFSHTFGRPGLYKLWLQFLYQGNVVTADYVVRVAP